MAQNPEVGMKCIKYMLFVSNFMFVMVGLLLISFGSTLKSIYYDFEIFMEDHYFSPALLTVAIGVIILLISSFGCAAAIKESTCMVNVYALFLFLVLILEISASIAAYTMRYDIDKAVENNMKEAMKNYWREEPFSTKEEIDFLQIQLNCCGIASKDDWMLYTNSTEIPKSCCQNYGPSTNDECIPKNDGCLDNLVYILKQSSVMLGSGALCITIVQILGIAFALMLAKGIRRIKTERAAQRWQTRQELYLQLARGNDKNPPSPVPVTYTPENSSTA